MYWSNNRMSFWSSNRIGEDIIKNKGVFMYISHIEINGFRMFENLKLKLNKGLNVFVGENNSGKTAILDAIRYVLDTNSADYINIDRNNDFYINNEGIQLSEFKIHLTFSDLSEENQATFLPYITYETEKDNIVAKLHLTLTCNKNNENRNGYIRKYVRTGANGEGKELDSVLKEELQVTYLKPLRDAENELSANKSSRLSKILEGYINFSQEEIDHPSTNFFDEIENFYKNISDKVEKLKTNDIKISDTIKNKYLKNLVLEKDKDKDIKLGIKSKDNRSKLREILNRLNLTYNNSYGKEGLGYQNILFIATELLLLESEIYNQAPIMLIEEPEAHLHPQLQINFLNFIKEKENNFQIFITTHSPNLSSKIPVKNLYICLKKNIYSLREEETKLDKEDYIFLEKFLDVTKADLFFARGLLLVEGISEQLLIPYISNLFGINLDKYGISVINIGNTAFKRFLKIFTRENGEDIPLPIGYITDLDIKGCWDSRSITEEKRNNAKQEKCKNDSQYHKGFVSEYRTLEVDLINKNKDKICKAIRRTHNPTENIESLSIEKLYGHIKDFKSELSYNLINFDPSQMKNLFKYLEKQENKNHYEEELFSLNGVDCDKNNFDKAKELLLLSKLDIPKYLCDAINFVKERVVE